MIKDSKTGKSLPADGINREIANIKELGDISEIEHYEFSNLPSPHIGVSDMWELSKLINKIVKNTDIKGVVVTHGTDTLEETAYFLDLTVNSHKPIVCTAAMRNIDETGTDGPRNVLSSVRVANSDLARSMGTLVCLNDEVHAAREVTKTYTSNVSTFDSPGYGPLGIVDEDKVIFFRKPLLRKTYKCEKIEENVALYKTFVGDNGKMLQEIPQMGYKGLVLEAFGRGNVPPGVAKVVNILINEKHIPTVLTSRCFKGRVLGVYGYEGGGADLEKKGVILAQGLSSQKARIELMIILGITKDRTLIKNMFDHLKRGEAFGEKSL
ncbi:MAG: asparaginase [Kosmotoga sp.]|nr:MAG: asparaginase [Kosmotoga sp.]